MNLDTIIKTHTGESIKEVINDKQVPLTFRAAISLGILSLSLDNKDSIRAWLMVQDLNKIKDYKFDLDKINFFIEKYGMSNEKTMIKGQVLTFLEDIKDNLRK